MKRSLLTSVTPSACLRSSLSPNATSCYGHALIFVVLLGLIGCNSDRAQAQDSESVSQEDSTDKDDEAHGEGEPNHLIDETSPYLLMHARNPVDWYPWGEEALTKAKNENKPIFLSIGYSSCHWCHVMERESFLDKEIAAYLNEHFVCIKVDREERPDIDNIYMRSLYVYQALTNGRAGGGWPLSMFLTPDALPFFGGTYFPARDGDRGAATGFLTLVQLINKAWTDNEEAITNDATVIADATRTELLGLEPEEDFKLEPSLIERAQVAFAADFDPEFGGFGYSPTNPRQPKFPQPSYLMFLLDRAENGPDEESRASALNMLTTTLDRMAMGGIRDHLDGGFHRYSVDRFWHIPHFEKMLYDNGQLATVYAEAYVITKNPVYQQVVHEMLEFVEADMRSDEGGFYSALDAESENEEGKYYRWTREEVVELLSDEEYKLFATAYGLEEEPNFEEHYAFLFNQPIEEVASALELEPAEMEAKLKPLRAKLLAVRDERVPPLTDTKILTSWNGLMIRGFADAGRIFEEEKYVELARDAANMMLEKLRTDDGRLLRTYGNGEAKLNAYLNDYAFLVDGLIALHHATGEEQWLSEADALMQKQIELFWDEEFGGFYFTSTDHESLLARAKNPVDQAQPAGSSVSVENLVRLSELLERDDYRERALQTITSVSGMLDRSPSASPRLMASIRKLIEED